MSQSKEHYLGDGLYASHDGFQFILRAPRAYDDHYVALEDDVLESFFRYIEKTRGLKITVERLEK